MKFPGPNVQEEAASLLADPSADLEEVARNLSSVHGERAYSVLWELLAGRSLPTAVARREWDDAVRLRDRMQEVLGEEVPLLVALLQSATRADPLLRSGRILSPATYARLEQSSNTDGLTGLYNYRYFRDALYRELKRSKRYRHPLALLLLDLDEFKRYNDANGHPAGDRALAETARLLVANCREIDVVCRYGGEEFVVILPATDKRGARIVGEKLRRRIEEHEFPGQEACPQGNLTVSGGISTFPEDGLTAEELVENADQALYQAKNFIKNAVCYYFREDRRAYPRIDKEYRLRYRVLGEAGWRDAVTRDISKGGLSLVVTGKPPALGAPLSLEIRAGARVLALEGEVVREERLESGGSTTLGIAFRSLSEDLEATLAGL